MSGVDTEPGAGNPYVSTEIRLWKNQLWDDASTITRTQTATVVAKLARQLESRNVSGEESAQGVVLIGSAGIGKTRFVEELRRELSQQGDGKSRVIQLLRASELGEDPWQALQVSGDQKEARERVKGGELVIALDGLDEAPDALFDRAVEFLNEIAGMAGAVFICAIRQECVVRDPSRGERLEALGSVAQITFGGFDGLFYEDARRFFLDETGSINSEREKQVNQLWKRGGKYGWFRRPLVMELLRSVEPTTEINSAFDLFSELRRNEPENLEKSVLEAVDAWEPNQRFGAKGFVEPSVGLKDEFDPSGSKLFRLSGGELRPKHRTVWEFFAALRIAEQYEQNKSRFRDYFFHWDTREFLVRAMEDQDRSYEDALREAVGLTKHSVYDEAFRSYAKLLDKPGEVELRLPADLVDHLVKHDRAYEENGSQQFLSYVLHDLRVLTFASLPVSDTIPDELQRLLKKIQSLNGAISERQFHKEGPESQLRLCFQALRACVDVGDVEADTVSYFATMGRHLMGAALLWLEGNSNVDATATQQLREQLSHLLESPDVHRVSPA